MATDKGLEDVPEGELLLQNTFIISRRRMLCVCVENWSRFCENLAVFWPNAATPKITAPL